MPSLEKMEKGSGTAERRLFERSASRITQVQENSDVVSVRRDDTLVCKHSLILGCLSLPGQPGLCKQALIPSSLCGQTVS